MFDPANPIWRRHWFQVLLGTLLILAVGSFVLPPVVWVIYATRSVLLPVLIALVLAYAVEPIVRWLEGQVRLPRPVSAGGLIVALLAAVAGLVLYLGPSFARQISQLTGWFQITFPAKMGEFVRWWSTSLEMLSQRWDEALPGPRKNPADSTPPPPPGDGPAPDEAASPKPEQGPADPTLSGQDQASEPANGSANGGPEPAPDAPAGADAGPAPGADTPGPAPGAEAAGADGGADAFRLAEKIDVQAILSALFDWLDVGYEVVASTIGFATYITLALGIIGFCFYFFVCKFPTMQSWCVPFIPRSYREPTLHILKRMDEAVSAFIRGRLLQAMVIAMVLSFGWWVFDVPYWLLLGILGGLLNLIPYAAVIVWPVALLLTGAQAFALDEPAFGLNFWWVFFWPTVVYIIAQSLDGWVMEPLVQGKATNLEPVTVLVAVLIGGSLAGLLGMLIAIPTAACARILLQEVLLPRFRQWANQM